MQTLLRAVACSSALFVFTTTASAQQLSVDITSISDAGIGKKIGTAVITQNPAGLAIKVTVPGIPKGQHGFHVHENGDCGSGQKDGKTVAGLAAGGHFDPDKAGSHKGPVGAGHKGDLPVLQSTNAGINQTVVVKRLKLADVQGRALVIHEGADNYSDKPENGGGAGRIACGVIGKLAATR